MSKSVYHVDMWFSGIVVAEDAAEAEEIFFSDLQKSSLSVLKQEDGCSDTYEIKDGPWWMEDESVLTKSGRMMLSESLPELFLKYQQEAIEKEESLRKNRVSAAEKFKDVIGSLTEDEREALGDSAINLVMNNIVLLSE